MPSGKNSTQEIRSMNHSAYRIGIVGAGTSGAFLAGLLACQGHDVMLFEKSPAPRTDGCGILLSKMGMQALQKGNPAICQAILAAGNPVRQYEFRNLKGAVAFTQGAELVVGEFANNLVHRKTILEALLAEVPTSCLRFGAKCQSIAQTTGSVTLELAGGDRWEGDLLVGADGLFSRVRDAVVPGVRPAYLGDKVWRGVVEDDRFCTDGHFIVYIRGRGIYANFLDLGNGLTHWGFFVEYEQTEAEKYVPRPFDCQLPANELAKLPEKARSVILSTPSDRIVARFSYDIDPLPRLYRGRVVAIGDAGHAKSPSQAWGMTAGFEDCLALARHLKTATTVEEALAGFQTERLPIVREYQNKSRAVSRKTGRLKQPAA